jgi:hypothetical protein
MQTIGLVRRREDAESVKQGRSILLSLNDG